MFNVKVSRIIKGDPDKVWELINQVDRFPEWIPGVVEARVKSSGRKKGIGRKQIVKTCTNLGEGESLQEVIAWEPPHRIAWQHLRDKLDGKELNHAKEIKTTLSITNINGEITLRMVGSWLPAGISRRLMNRFVKRTMTRNFEKALDNLQGLLRNGISAGK